ncbi:hypothetical protein GCM10020331_088260 [Ectobacillus funiculus]
MKLTIYTVAQEAGVSIATVSKVINNTGRISEKNETKKVLKTMERLNYHPSTVASALTGKRDKKTLACSFQMLRTRSLLRLREVLKIIAIH